jgi:hypothetical protein
MTIAYLAAPYSHHDKSVVEQRMSVLCNVDAMLMERGIHTVTPLSKHFILNYRDLPGDWAYWGEYSKKLLARCDSMYVLMLKGWRESTGVQAEINIAKELNIPIVFITEAGEILESSQYNLPQTF